MIRVLGTIFAGLLGLAFGSFLNVCLSRWPEGESVVAPRSHCRNCDHTLAWWENIPLVSWLALRGRCRQCRTWIGWRYPVVEAAVSVLWAISFFAFLRAIEIPRLSSTDFFSFLVATVGDALFYWLLVALAFLDADHLWLPDWLTLPGTAIGVASVVLHTHLHAYSVLSHFGANALHKRILIHIASQRLLAVLAAAGIILVIRWIYKLIRKREGLGLGDAKLMALLAAWLGLPLTLVAFVIAVLLGSLAAILLLVRPALQRDGETWAVSKLPLGTFLCIGGIISSLWGQPILNAYLRWAGL